jgi:hypothetical protein
MNSNLVFHDRLPDSFVFLGCDRQGVHERRPLWPALVLFLLL